MKNVPTVSAFLLTASVVEVGVMPAFAAEAEGAKSGLPQLDVALFPGQLFWLAVTFVILYVLMAFIALPRVKKTQEKRQEILSQDLAAAEASNESAKEMLAHYEKTRTDARIKAQVVVNEMLAAGEREAAEHETVQQHELSRRLASAESDIIVTRNEAIKNLSGVVSDLSQSIVEKVSGYKKACGMGVS